jgi:hypothetical protein
MVIIWGNNKIILVNYTLRDNDFQVTVIKRYMAKRHDKIGLRNFLILSSLINITIATIISRRTGSHKCTRQTSKKYQTNRPGTGAANVLNFRLPVTIIMPMSKMLNIAVNTQVYHVKDVHLLIPVLGN